jgi:hypothetical protein
MPRLLNVDLTFDNSGAVGSGTLTSGWIDVSEVTSINVQLTIASGTAPTGTVKIQCSNDRAADQSAPGTLTAVDIASATAAFTDNGSARIPLADAGYKWIRAIWTKTSGTGTLTGNVNGKGPS